MEEDDVANPLLEETVLRFDGRTVRGGIRCNQDYLPGQTCRSTANEGHQQRKQAEAATKRLAAIVESSDDAIVAKTLDGTILSWNAGAEGIYGYSAAEVVGRPISVLVPPDRSDELPQILAKLARGERIAHYHTERVRKDGRRIQISLTISPLIDSEGKIVGASMIARDITKQKQVEEELQCARKAADEAEIHGRDALTALKEVETRSVQTCITSPHSISARLLTTQSFARAKGNTSGTDTSVPKVASRDDVSQVGRASVTAFTRLGGSWRLVVLLPRSE